MIDYCFKVTVGHEVLTFGPSDTAFRQMLCVIRCVLSNIADAWIIIVIGLNLFGDEFVSVLSMKQCVL